VADAELLVSLRLATDTPSVIVECYLIADEPWGWTLVYCTLLSPLYTALIFEYALEFLVV